MPCGASILRRPGRSRCRPRSCDCGRSSDESIATSSIGYVLDGDPEAIDAVRFERFARRASNCARAATPSAPSTSAGAPSRCGAAPPTAPFRHGSRPSSRRRARGGPEHRRGGARGGAPRLRGASQRDRERRSPGSRAAAARAPVEPARDRALPQRTQADALAALRRPASGSRTNSGSSPARSSPPSRPRSCTMIPPSCRRPAVRRRARTARTRACTVRDR